MKDLDPMVLSPPLGATISRAPCISVVGPEYQAFKALHHIADSPPSGGLEVRLTKEIREYHSKSIRSVEALSDTTAYLKLRILGGRSVAHESPNRH